MFNDYSKEYCLTCEKENDINQKICNCGGRNFVFGDNFSYNNKTVQCDCGNDKEFEMKFHLNRDPVHDYSYQCFNCKNIIGVQKYIESL